MRRAGRQHDRFVEIAARTQHGQPGLSQPQQDDRHADIESAIDRVARAADATGVVWIVDGDQDVRVTQQELRLSAERVRPLAEGIAIGLCGQLALLGRRRRHQAIELDHERACVPLSGEPQPVGHRAVGHIVVAATRQHGPEHAAHIVGLVAGDEDIARDLIGAVGEAGHQRQPRLRAGDEALRQRIVHSRRHVRQGAKARGDGAEREGQPFFEKFSRAVLDFALSGKRERQSQGRLGWGGRSDIGVVMLC